MTFKYKKIKPLKAGFLILSLSALLLLSACQSTPAETAEESISPSPTASATPEEIEESVAPPSVSQSTKPSPSPTPSPTPTPFSPDVPENEPVDNEFFKNSAFMGNSLMDGFRMFSGLTPEETDYYAATSLTVQSATNNATITLDNGNQGTIVEGLIQKPYERIYILLGINEIGYEVEAFIDLYANMLDQIIEGQPDCDIYILGLSPVSQAKSRGDKLFNIDRVKAYNEALYNLALEKEVYYLNLFDALADESGFLPGSETTDGVHLSVKMYEKWYDYIKTHYVD